MSNKMKKTPESTETEEEEIYLKYTIEGGINIDNHGAGTINVTIIQSGNPSQPQPPKP